MKVTISIKHPGVPEEQVSVSLEPGHQHFHINDVMLLRAISSCRDKLRDEGFIERRVGGGDRRVG